ncbi:oxidoreductase [Phytomonospora endophytica]|uniref:Aryl-alcohol dehydrogenase-like predicted oxidoreductase n=1 Tax=Phytomonospora endophytica TaxID=714109 RepID=A0A841FKB1_9ACTN|nr:oxidoreductase [Phytomonospora endophytica]MBB6037771.1 aryl-alcohol dehydrogenase-like predicted oxidoreductase [Phytomonospora endophytica]GIG67699.1 oxidoreductase [Phytomonospora endophytica]
MTNPASAAGRFLLGGDLDVARIGYGSMKLTNWPQGGRSPERETALRVLREAVALGVNHIDTSYYYVDGEGFRAPELIREALHPYPEDLVIVTKVGPIMTGVEGDAHDGLEPERLREAVEWNLAALGVERVDVVNLRVDGVNPLPGGTLQQPLESLLKLKDEGLIGHIGISNVRQDRFEEAMRYAPIACVQNLYNLGRRETSDPIIDACERAGIAFVPFFPVSGFDEETTAKVAAVAARHSSTPQQIALAWLLRRSPNILLIPGTGSPAHLAENVAAAGIELSDADLADLDRTQVPD